MDNVLIAGEQKTDFGHKENNQKTGQDSFWKGNLIQLINNQNL